MLTPETFLSECKAHAERKFWIQRVYDHLLFAGLVTQAIPIPRSLKQAPYLGLVAEYRAHENRYGTTPSAATLATWFANAQAKGAS